MSGHSKWANIKHRKGANDAKRGKVFTRLIKEITVATKSGGADINSNSRLRLAIQNAKGSNMPKDTIERAIKKASGEGSADYISVSYEGYAPGGVAIFVECMTDNLNRTVSLVRSTFTKYGGNLGKNGSIAYLFDRTGTFSLNIDNIEDEDVLTLELIDCGVDEIEKDDGYLYITCSIDNFGNVQRKLDELKIEPESAEIQYVPNTVVTLNEDDVKKVIKFLDAMEDNDDVQKVYHNIEISATQEHLFN